MANFQTNLDFIFFQLFDVLKIHLNNGGDQDQGTYKDIILEFQKFVANEVYPTRTKGDEAGVQLSHYLNSKGQKESRVITPECFKEANRKYYENGWYGLGYDEELGGIPMPHSIALLCESILNGANVALSMYSGLTRGAMDVILKVANETQKSRYVPQMMSGMSGGTMCLTESGAGSDVGALKTTAKKMSDGLYSIQGVKIFISSGDNDLYQNIFHLVLARTEKGEAGTKGLSLFIVPKYRLNSDGSPGEFNHVVCTKIEEKMGIHAQATCELTFGGEGECLGEMLGEEFDGIKNMFIMMNTARLLCGIQGESQANLAYELTRQYAKERIQFDREIEKHPDVARMLNIMEAKCLGMRSLVLYIGHLFDLEKQALDQGKLDVASTLEKEIQFLTPIAKAYCSEEGFDVSVMAIQVHGGYGFCSEYGIEQFARDTKIATIYEGTNGIQAIDFLTRKVLKDKAQVLTAMNKKILGTIQSDPLREYVSIKNEIEYLQHNCQKVEEMMTLFASLSNPNALLSHATPFLSYMSHVIVAWRLCENLKVALEKHQELTKVNKLTEKDERLTQECQRALKTYVKSCLTKNAGIAKEILNF